MDYLNGPDSPVEELDAFTWMAEKGDQQKPVRDAHTGCQYQTVRFHSRRTLMIVVVLGVVCLLGSLVCTAMSTVLVAKIVSLGTLQAHPGQEALLWRPSTALNNGGKLRSCGLLMEKATALGCDIDSVLYA